MPLSLDQRVQKVYPGAVIQEQVNGRLLLMLPSGRIHVSEATLEVVGQTFECKRNVEEGRGRAYSARTFSAIGDPDSGHRRKPRMWD